MISEFEKRRNCRKHNSFISGLSPGECAQFGFIIKQLYSYGILDGPRDNYNIPRIYRRYNKFLKVFSKTSSSAYCELFFSVNKYGLLDYDFYCDLYKLMMMIIVLIHIRRSKKRRTSMKEGYLTKIKPTIKKNQRLYAEYLVK
eukprot:Lithocolla_globosa_v1_NODE_30_length_9033_cov_22.154583.p6 type:complete len:143 gc:universal NODE_30_length_9033_cov_22.154583:1560-1132(-)